jgi:hypothetical protein
MLQKSGRIPGLSKPEIAKNGQSVAFPNVCSSSIEMGQAEPMISPKHPNGDLFRHTGTVLAIFKPAFLKPPSCNNPSYGCHALFSLCHAKAVPPTGREAAWTLTSQRVLSRRTAASWHCDLNLRLP